MESCFYRIFTFYVFQCLPSFLFIFDSGIDYAVDKVNDEVYKNEHRCDDKNGTLYYRVVIFSYGVDKIGTDAVDYENLFGDYCTAEKNAEACSKLSKKRNHRISEGVDKDYGFSFKTFGFRGSDIVGLENVEHCASSDSGETCDSRGGKSDRRKDCLLETGGGPEEMGHAAGRKDLENNCENVDEHGSEPEVRDRDTDHCSGGEDIIDEFIFFECGNDARRNSDDY